MGAMYVSVWIERRVSPGGPVVGRRSPKPSAEVRFLAGVLGVRWGRARRCRRSYAGREGPLRAPHWTNGSVTWFSSRGWGFDSPVRYESRSSVGRGSRSRDETGPQATTGTLGNQRAGFDTPDRLEGLNGVDRRKTARGPSLRPGFDSRQLHREQGVVVPRGKPGPLRVAPKTQAPGAGRAHC